MKINKFIVKGIAFFFLLSLVFALMLTPASAVIYDYSSQGATSKITLTTLEIIDELFKDDGGFALTDEEREYLSLYGEDTLTYGTRIPSSYITSDFNEINRELTIKAEVYSYKALSGNITWIPSRVTFMGENVDFSLVGGEYVAVIYGASPGEEDNAEVLYTASINFSYDIVNELVNKAYNDAYAWDSYKSYVSELAEYKTNLAAYEKYLSDKQIYNDKYKEYQAYLAEKAEYDKAYDLFIKYEEALSEYNTKYAAFIQYQNDLKAYNDNLILYNKYVENIKIANEQITTLLNTNKSLPTIGRPLYGAIMGPTVTQVVENKDAIANELTGVDGSVVDMAGEATEKLKEILPAFHALTTDADRYLYYSLNYEQIRVNFNKLFTSLDYLYGNGKVRYALGEMEMKDKYEIFLAQLYYVVLALNDAPVYKYNSTATYTASYKINEKTPKSLCEGEEYTPDVRTAVPLPYGYPTRVDEPTEPSAVEEPKKPTEVVKPTEPPVVNEPGIPPVPVERPVAPAEVKAPKPSLVGEGGELPESILKLIDAYNSGKIIRRTAYDTDKVLEAKAYATKRIVNVDIIEVNFYDRIGGALLESVSAERGSYVEYSEELPTMSSVDKIYTFAGWTDEDGSIVDMTHINPQGDVISLYPSFTWEYKTFEVGWDILGNISYEAYSYGEVPSYKGVTPEKADEGSYMFTFDGWGESFAPVTGNKIYIASFKKSPIVADPNGIAATVTLDADEQMYIADATASISKSFDVSALLARAKAARVGVKLIMRAGSFVLPYSEVVKANDCGATFVKLLSLKRGSQDNMSYIFSLSFTTPEGDAPGELIRATLSLPYTILDTVKTQICYDKNGSSEPVRYTAKDNEITVAVDCGVQYFSVLKYNIDVLKYEGITLTASISSAEAGERVTFSYNLPDGLRLISLYYIDGNGNTVYLDATIFDMPASDITLALSYEVITYTVKFKSEGKVISTATYKHGETPVAPGTPNIADDGKYTYKFVGWDKEIGPVYSDITYTAVYEKNEIVKENDKTDNGDKGDATGGLKITPGVMRILLVVLYALVLMPAFIVILIRVFVGIFRKRKRSKNIK